MGAVLLPVIMSLLFIKTKCDADFNSDLCQTSRSLINIPGDVNLIVLLDGHEGPDCSIPVLLGTHQILSAIWAVHAMNVHNTVPGVKIGMKLYDTCSSPTHMHKTLIRSIVENECHSAYSIGVLTTASASRELEDLLPLLNVPTTVIHPEHHDTVAQLTVALLSEIHWNQINYALASSTKVLDSFREQANRDKICVHHYVLIEDTINRTWLSAEDLKESEYYIVIFGSLSEIQEIALLSQQDALNDSSIQWIFVIVEQNQNFIPLGKFSDNSIIIAPRNISTQNFTDMPEISPNYIYNASNVVHSQFSLPIVFSILQLSCKLRTTIEQYCKTTATPRLCSSLPSFNEIVHTLGSSNCGLTDLVNNLYSENEYPYTILQVTSDRDLQEIGHFELLDKEFKFQAKLQRSATSNIKTPEEDNLCDDDNVNSHCKEYCGEFYVSLQNQITVPPTNSYNDSILIMWREETWVAAIASVSAIGILCSIIVFFFILCRLCKGDILEGNSSSSFLLLFSVDMTYCSILPYCLLSEDVFLNYIICQLRASGVSIGYAMIFSVMLSRSLMLATCDQEESLSSHISGYLQTVLCFFIFSVEAALCSQFWFIHSISYGFKECSYIYEGYYFIILIGYDALLLLLTVCTIPFIVRSRRNYKEGLFFTISSLLCLIMFAGWCTAYFMLPNRWRDAIVTAGLVANATVILTTLFIPRTYLMIKAIVRDELVSALPPLSSQSVQSILPHSLESNVYAGQSQPIGSHGPKPREDFQLAEGSISPENTYERYDTPPSPLKVSVL